MVDLEVGVEMLWKEVKASEVKDVVFLSSACARTFGPVSKEGALTS